MKTEPLDLLAIGAHPDDVELGCGGTLAKLAAAGRRVGIVHLTRGEMGSRGTAQEREREAQDAAEILGAVVLETLDCVDGELRSGRDEEDSLIALLRRHRPDVILGPSPNDRHPDHGRAHRLVQSAVFYSGLTKRVLAGSSDEPFRPGAVFSYMQHDHFSPSFIVDVSPFWATKERALDAYSSQLFKPESDPDSKPAIHEEGPITKVATPEFRLAVRGRAQHFGQMIGAAFGEPFLASNPLAVGDPIDLLPGGVR